VNGQAQENVGGSNASHSGDGGTTSTVTLPRAAVKSELLGESHSEGSRKARSSNAT